MPKKGMGCLLFSPKKAITSSSSSVSTIHLSSPKSIFPEAFTDRSLLIAEEMIKKWDPDVSTFAKVTSLFYQNRREAFDFIKCVNHLQKSMHFLVTEYPDSEKLRKGQELMEIAMRRLQKEFYQILSMNRTHLDPESMSAKSSRTSVGSSISDFDDEDDEIRVVEDSINEVEDVSNATMVELRSIAECMIQCGYGKECVTIYKLIRKSIIDEGIYKLGVVKLSSSHVHKMEWKALEIKIKSWLVAVKIAVKTLFNGEKILCDHIFASSKKITESCFSDISKEGAHTLFGFPENVAKNSKKSLEKVFRLLDMYVEITENWPAIDSIFSSDSLSTVRTQVENSLIRISEFVRTDIKEFECVIQKDVSRSLVLGSGIHPLTTRIVNYLTTLADYNNVLMDILEISRIFAWLVLVLVCKLDTKSKHYNDVSLAYLFLANNIQYIVTKVRSSNMNPIFGDDWLTEHEIKVKQFAANYERLAWDHVIKSLPGKPKENVSKEEATKWFMRFNIAFEQAHHKQSVCIIPDRNLRDSIKESIAKKMVPVYREFYDTYNVSNSNSKVKFTPEDVANWLSDLYFVTTGSGSEAFVSSSSNSFERASLSC